MKFQRCEQSSGWYCQIKLEPHEWPSIINDNNWDDRPIRQWVFDNCYPGVFFDASGWILFEREEDATMFRMVWG